MEAAIAAKLTFLGYI
uniref:Uncharacterized protein n=1 Tax=Rhizophora mucronata TaxID=61149 RepID=A0A2P2NSB8_RHIMU